MRWAAAALVAVVALAQEVDTVLYEGETKSANLYAQIDDAGERRALQALFETRDRGERSARVKRFLEAYPGSAFLSVVYEVGARSASDLGEALGFGRQSLRLLPENPLLQMAVAELEGREWKAPAELARGEQKPARYAGSAVCRTCHAKEHAHWQQTGMARMLRPYAAEAVKGDFSGRVIAGEDGTALARFVTVDGRPQIEMGGRRFAVEFTVGSKWQQAYATRGPDGRVHVFPYQYNYRQGTWLNYWKRIDPPGSARTDPATFLKFSAATDYLRNCAPCHTSQLTAAGYREPGVNCEMCHGPSADHAAKPEKAKDPMAPPVSFRKIGAREYLAICGQCHRQSAMFRRAAEGGLNYSGTAPAFWLEAKKRPLIEFSRKAFYRDGRFRETTFIVEALERSQCFQKGGAHCGHCHDPHPENAAKNGTSLKFVDTPDRMCTQCHEKPRASAAHTQHRGKACVDCHMPRITNSLLFQARTHTIDDIPSEEMWKRFGNAQSPYVCRECHARAR